MVTLPSAASDDWRIVDELVEAGMTVARINCSHDRPEDRLAMAHHVRSSAERQDREVRIAFDLPGPKLRTGPFEPGPDALKVRPSRDGTVALGRSVAAGP
jgi:pyruvate kinase